MAEQAARIGASRSMRRSRKVSFPRDHAGVKAVAEAFGYSAEELTSIPAEANMGLSCGNPTAIASIRPGEVVVDLGFGRRSGCVSCVETGRTYRERPSAST